MLFQRNACISSLLFLLILCSCSAATMQVPTPIPLPTPTVIQLTSDLVEVSARPLPIGSDVRWSKSTYRIQVRVSNLTNSKLVAEVLTTASDDFMFVIPEKERNQTLQNNNHTIKTQIILIPRTNDQPSYGEIVFETVQAENIISGTHNFIVQVTLPGRDPLRIPLVFEVLDQVSLKARGNESPAQVPPSTACPADTTFYIVQRGDTLNMLSKSHGTTNAKIIQANTGKIPNPDALRIGIELCIPLS